MRWMWRAARRAVAATVLLLGMASPALAQSRPYSVEDLLALEEVGKAVFSPEGDLVVFNHEPPYASEGRLGLGRILSGSTKILAAEVRGSAPAEPLFPQTADEAWSVGAFSPDGRYLSFTHIGVGFHRMGVWDRRTDRIVEAPAPADHARIAAGSPIWVSDHQMVYVATAPGRLPQLMEVYGPDWDGLAERWRQQRRGELATSQSWGSGSLRDRAAPSRGGGLALFDARTGQSRPLTTGPVRGWAVSPDGDGIAISRARDVQTVATGDEIAASDAGLEGLYRYELILASLSGAKPDRVVCSDCDVDPTLIQWSPDGRLAYEVDVHSESPSLELHDPRSGARVPLRTDGLKWSDGARLDCGGDHCLLQAVPVHSPADRADWWRLSTDAAPVNLTGSLKTPADLLQNRGARPVFLTATGVFRADADGGLEPVAGLAPAARRPATAGGQPGSAQALLVEADPGHADGFSLVQVNLETGAVTRRDAIGTYLAAAPQGDAVLTRRVEGGVGRLSLVAGDGSSREVFSYNRHLADVATSRRLPIHHRSVAGADLVSWLLLPPDVEGPLPVVVHMYPGTRYRQSYSGIEPDEFSFLNPEVLVGRGYAVLLASLPLNENGPGEPAADLAENVLLALDAAAETGLVDSSRAAIEGHSFGGFAAATIVTRTNRFKAAVALSGVYDFTSFYGTLSSGRPTSRDAPLFAHNWSETSQPDFRTTPWADPERYMRNSPVYHADRIETPLLIMHGDHDWVSITQAEEMFGALYRQGKDAEFVRYFGEDHHYLSPANIRDFWERLFVWLETYLGPPADR